MKIAVITCYFDPDYVRGAVLRDALRSLPDVDVIECKNSNLGMLRYPEMIWKIWKLRRQRPDAYLLTFRGQEVLPYVLMIAGKKPVCFDEMIIPIAYASYEKHVKLFDKRVKYFLARLSEPLYRRWLSKCRGILADTRAHAEVSARTAQINIRNYTVVPVGANDHLFKPGDSQRDRANTKFQVFYYGNMLPLHGLDTVIAAAEQLKNNQTIEFILIGGKQPMADKIALAQSRGAHITYRKWVPFNEIPGLLRDCDVFLAGPYGGTPQAQHVITGKAYQALACAVPIIVGASEADDEYFVNKQNALVVPQANSSALVTAIVWAQQHPDELAAIAQNGRRLYTKEFTTASIAKRLQPLVNEL